VEKFATGAAAIFEMVVMEYSGAGGKLIHGKKTRSKKSRDTVPLRQFFLSFQGERD
jgi:hypothetical protein